MGFWCLAPQSDLEGVSMSDEISQIESKVAPPTVHCPKCESMLPHELGEIKCGVCSSISRIEHKPTRDAWEDEKVGCPNCPKILRVGVPERPCALRCSSCDSVFKITRKVVKIEISCPSCERNLRVRPRPGKRRIECPACSDAFHVTF